MWKQTGWDLNPRPVNRKSNALPQRQHATRVCVNVKHRYSAAAAVVVFVHVEFSSSVCVAVLSWCLVWCDADRRRLVRTKQWPGRGWRAAVVGWRRTFGRRRLQRRRSVSRCRQRHERPVDGVVMQPVPRRRRPVTAGSARQRERRAGGGRGQVAHRRRGRSSSSSRLQGRDQRRGARTGRCRQWWRTWRQAAWVLALGVQQRCYCRRLHHVRVETRLVSSRCSSCRQVIRPDDWL